MEMIYLDHNKQPHLLEIDRYQQFESFVKTNIFDLNWAKLMSNNIIIDEYTNLSSFDVKNIELHFPSYLTNNAYTILSKWNIEIFKDFIKRHFPEYLPHFWSTPRQYSFDSVGMAVYGNDGAVIVSTMEQHSANTFKPPSDLIIIDAQYFNQQFSALSQLVRTKAQQEELAALDQFTMFSLGV